MTTYYASRERGTGLLLLLEQPAAPDPFSLVNHQRNALRRGNILQRIPIHQQQIRRQLQDSRSQLLKAAYLEMLRDQAKVENYLAEQIFRDSAK